MNFTFDRLVGAALLVALSVAGPGVADPRLRKGMTPPEVVKILGAPLERTEFEARREESWRFEKFTALFKQGELVSWSTSPGAVLPVEPVEPAEVVADGTKKKSEEPAFAVEEILTEIMKEGPSKDDPENKAGIPPSLPVNPMNPLPEVSQ